MFDRYTERARRVIFYARAATSQFGGPCIESEHMLLGILREDPAFLSCFLLPSDSVRQLRHDAEAAAAKGQDKLPTTADIPLNEDSKQMLTLATAEADGLSHREVDLGHLLLGLLRTGASTAAQILRHHGLDAEQLRQYIRNAPDSLPPAVYVGDAATAIEIADALWTSFYGEAAVQRQKPYRAQLLGETWRVLGTRPPEASEMTLGADIARTDGRILRVGYQ